MAFENNSQTALRILALIDDQFARMRMSIWSLPLDPQELADAIDAAIISTELAYDFGKRLHDWRKEAGYEY